MKIVMNSIDGKVLEATDISELTFTDTADAACSSLCFKYKNAGELEEIYSVRAYENGKIIFNGFCDCQRVTACDDGYEAFVYARSSAGVLVDCECEPIAFNCPSARQLWTQFARAAGFKYALPEIFSNEKYEVSSGISCFGAINNFVSAVTGSKIYVNPKNEITLRTLSEDIKSLNAYDIISQSVVINRSEAIYQINYKNDEDKRYIRHMSSDLARDKKISSEIYVNLASLPAWQREKNISQRLKSSFDNYFLIEIVLSGNITDELFQRFSFKGEIGEFDDFILVEKKYTFDSGGEKTKLTLRKNIQTGDVIYVA